MRTHKWQARKGVVAAKGFDFRRMVRLADSMAETGDLPATVAPGGANRRVWPAMLAWSAAVVAASGGWSAARRALWTDELFSLVTAEGSPREILRNLAAYQPGFFDHPPLFFLLLREVLFLGNSPLLLRLLPLLFATVAAATVGVCLRRRGTPRAAAFAVVAAFVACPAVLFPATFVRMYSLVAALSAGLMWCVSEVASHPVVVRHTRWLGVSIALLLAAMFYTSYFALILGATLGLVAAAWIAAPRVAGGTRAAGVVLLLALVLALLLYLPWFPAVARLVGGESATPSGAVKTDLAARLQFPARFLWSLGGSWVANCVLLAGWSSMMWRSGNRRFWAACALAAIVMPAIVLAAAAPAQRPLAPRYLVFALPWAWTGAALGWIKGLDAARLRRLTPGAVAALAFAATVPFTLAQSWREFMRPAPDWWEAAGIIERHARRDEVILTGGFLSGEALVYHLREPDRFSFHHYVTGMDPFYLECRSPQVVWYVNAAPLPRAYEDIVRRYFPWSVRMEGNMGADGILVCAKKPFSLSGGTAAEHREPAPLPYEK